MPHTAPIHLRGDQAGGGWSIEVVHISDTHDKNQAALRNCPSGDVLLHTGDFTHDGTIEEFKEFVRYLHKFPHKYKIVLAGNHELALPELGADRVQQMLNDPGLLDEPERSSLHTRPPVVYLQDSSAVICGIHFYGTPWTSCRAMAFGLSERERATQFSYIPTDTDVLLSHSPPYAQFDLAWSRPRPGAQDYHCDTCNESHQSNFHHWGCHALLQAVEQRDIPLHCFGHVHDQTGSYRAGNTVYSNAAFDLHGHKATGKYTLVVPSDRPTADQFPVYADPGANHNHNHEDQQHERPSSSGSLRTRLASRLGLSSADPGAPCLIRNQMTRNVLDVDYNRKEPGTKVIGYPATGALNQQWRFLPGGHLESVSSGLVLDADTQNGMQPIIYSKHKGANQRLSYLPSDRTLRLGAKGAGGATLVLTETRKGELWFAALEGEPTRQQQWKLVTRW